MGAPAKARDASCQVHLGSCSLSEGQPHQGPPLLQPKAKTKLTRCAECVPSLWPARVCGRAKQKDELTHRHTSVKCRTDPSLPQGLLRVLCSLLCSFLPPFSTTELYPSPLKAISEPGSKLSSISYPILIQSF